MTLLLFARIRDLVGADRMNVPDVQTVGELRRHLTAQFPLFAGLIARSAFAVNDEFADDATLIPAGAEVALLPPVSGG